MLWLVLLKMRLARIALAKRFACGQFSVLPMPLYRVPPYLQRNLLLVFSREVDELIVLGSHEERDGCLIEPAALAVPFLDRVQRALTSEVEHEQDRHSIIANQWEHVDKLSLAAQVPNREGNFRVPNGDGLFHEVYPCQARQHFAPDLQFIGGLPRVWM